MDRDKFSTVSLMVPIVGVLLGTFDSFVDGNYRGCPISTVTIMGVLLVIWINQKSSAFFQVSIQSQR